MDWRACQLSKRRAPAVNRRIVVGLALVPLALAPIAWASTGADAGSEGRAPRATGPLSPERESGCPGRWRWAVKTLSDKPQASTVSFYSKLKTVAELGALPRPSVKISSATLDVPRQPGPEKKTYRVSAVLVKFAKEDDGDIHLVIADPGANGKRMVAEFPNADCDGAALSAKQPQMAAARRTLLDHCGPAPSSFKRLEGTATVKGVGFFDFKHAGDQADNWMELHPVVKLTDVVCKRVPG
jgi:hypothetical protein